MKFIDMHIHCLPKIDDGSRSKTETLEILKRENEQGVNAIIATPHSSAFNSNTCVYINQLAQSFSTKEMPVFLGCEIYSPIYLVRDNLAMLEKGVIPSMNMSRYILVEFDPETKYETINQACMEYYKNEWIPIIAHVERYNLNLYDINLLKDKGYKIQTNAYSLFDEQKESVKKRAIQLLKHNKIDLIGSDSHRLNHRPPHIINGIKQVMDILDTKNAEDILYNNANSWFKLNLT